MPATEFKGLSRLEWLLVALVCSLLLLVWVLTPNIVALFGYAQPAGAGEFGDQFGAITALFTAGSLGGVILAIWLQARELRNHIKEASRQAEALIDQQESLRASNEFSALEAILRDYRSASIMEAVEQLWNFRRECGDDDDILKQRYLEHFARDKHQMSMLEPAERIAYRSGTLHYHRRSVESIYNLIAVAVEAGMVQKSTVYLYFNHKDLEIIPRLFFPIHHAVVTLTDRSPTSWGKYRLATLYDDAPGKLLQLDNNSNADIDGCD